MGFGPVHGSEMIRGGGHEKAFDLRRSRSSCSQTNMEGKSFNPAYSTASRFNCCLLSADTTGLALGFALVAAPTPYNF